MRHHRNANYKLLHGQYESLITLIHSLTTRQVCVCELQTKTTTTTAAVRNKYVGNAIQLNNFSRTQCDQQQSQCLIFTCNLRDFWLIWSIFNCVSPRIATKFSCFLAVSSFFYAATIDVGSLHFTSTQFIEEFWELCCLWFAWCHRKRDWDRTRKQNASIWFRPQPATSSHSIWN